MRTRHSLFAAILVVFAGASSAPALGWGPAGHEYIATAARDRLEKIDPEAVRTFNWLLRDDSIAVSGIVKKTKKPKTCHGRNLNEIASWPDCIRYLKEYAKTSPFHFDDIPLCVSTAPADPPPDKSSYCKDGKCATDGLAFYIARLKNKSLSRAERAQALAWVIHIVGDLHQPLHNIDNDDSGGNFVTVTLEKHAIDGSNFTEGKLHGLWDTPMVIAAVGSGSDAIEVMKARAEANANDPAWESLDFDGWSRVSHEQARLAYQKVEIPPMCRAGTVKGGKVSAAYVSFFKDKVEDQLAAASLRLSLILSDALH